MIPVTVGRIAAGGTNNRLRVLWVGMATSRTVTATRNPQPLSADVAVPSRLRMIVVLGALVALGPLTIDMYLPALPRIADELGVSSSVAQLTLTGTLAGLALGQLIVGPLSDSLGRRRPLMAGIALHMLASLLCLFAPDIAVLSLARGLQGMGAAAAMVVAVAVVGDLFDDSAAATVMSRLMLILGVAPIVAPSLGAAVLLKASWHWVFAVLIVLAGALLLVAALALPEDPPGGQPPTAAGPLDRGDLRESAARSEVRHPGDRRRARDGRAVRLYRRRGLRPAGPPRSGSADVRVGVRGGAIAFVVATQLNVILLRRLSPQRILMIALTVATGVGAVFVALSVTHTGGIYGFLIPVWAVLAMMGFVIPNAPAVALSRHHEASGTAAALLGAAQFSVGAVIAPVVGLMGNDEVALSVVMTAGVAIALVALLFVGGTDDAAPSQTPQR